MREIRALLQQIQHGSTGQRLGAVQKLLSLETNEYTGDQVAVPGVVLVLLALLGPTYSGLQDGVQQGAASLLLDIVSTSQAGMETLVDCQSSHMLIQTMQCGTYTKRSCIAAILGLLSMTEWKHGQIKPEQQDTISFYATPSIVKLLSEAGAAQPECRGMLIASLESLVHGSAAVDSFVQVGGVQVLSQVFSALSENALSTLSSDPDSDDDETDMRLSEVQQLQLAALQILHRVVSCNLVGISCVVQAPILTAILSCTSSPCEELQFASLVIISALAAIPITWPAFAQVGQAWHLAVAVNSHNIQIRAKALACVRALASTFSPQEEELIVRLAGSLDRSDFGQLQPNLQQQQLAAVCTQPSVSQQSAATLSHNTTNLHTEDGTAAA